jgi:hypothetical protein
MNCKKYQIKVLHWNANGIRNKISELYEFMKENGTDIVCLNETFLKPEITLKTNPRFIVHRFDRLEQAKGGVAIIIRRRIKHQIISFINTKLLECIGVKIKLTDGSSIDVISAYLPGGSTNSQINQHYINDINMLTNRGGCFFICGDLNSKHRFWNCQQANRAGTLLFEEHVNGSFLLSFPPTPTYFPADPNRLPSTLDLVLTNGKYNFSEPISLTMNSDHTAISFDINLSKSMLFNDTQLIPDFLNANWDLYKSKITENLSVIDIKIEDINSTNQIDSLTHLLKIQ